MIAWIVPLLVLVGGICWVYSARDLFVDGFRSYSWPHTSGRIIDQEDRSFFGPGLVGTARTGVGLVQYRETGYFYEYEVGLTRYVGGLYCFGAHIDKALARYVVGDLVKVYYNPKNPREAVLRRGVQLGTWLSIVPVLVGLVSLTWILARRS